MQDQDEPEDIIQCNGMTYRVVAKNLQTKEPKPFVYLWYQNNVCEYVGCTTRIHLRFVNHTKVHPDVVKGNDTFVFIPCATITQMRVLENALIQELKPKRNSPMLKADAKGVKLL